MSDEDKSVPKTDAQVYGSEPNLRPSPIYEASEASLAWATGIFEGEGTISLSERREGQWHCHLSVTMTDEDVVRRLHSILGGNVTGPHTKPSQEGKGYKPFWHWQLSGHDNVGAALNLMWPWLGERRRAKATEARDKTHMVFSRKGPRKAPWDIAGMEIWKKLHEDLTILTAWMAEQDYSPGDIAYAVERYEKYEDELAQAKAALVVEESIEAIEGGVLWDDPDSPEAKKAREDLRDLAANLRADRVAGYPSEQATQPERREGGDPDTSLPPARSHLRVVQGGKASRS
jgi:hypothetical protein